MWTKTDKIPLNRSPYFLSHDFHARLFYTCTLGLLQLAHALFASGLHQPVYAWASFAHSTPWVNFRVSIVYAAAILTMRGMGVFLAITRGGVISCRFSCLVRNWPFYPWVVSSSTSGISECNSSLLSSVPMFFSLCVAIFVWLFGINFSSGP